jgi:hypothetical protein
VYFEGFDIVPNYQKEGGALVFVQVVYTVKNLYQRVEKGEVFLQVNHGDAAPVELPLATISPLETGRVGLNYNYIPDGGWVDGSYSFKLRLQLDDKAYATSPVQQFQVGGAGGAPVSGSGSAMTPALIGGIAGAVVIAGGVAWWLVRKRNRA